MYYTMHNAEKQIAQSECILYTCSESQVNDEFMENACMVTFDTVLQMHIDTHTHTHT